MVPSGELFLFFILAIGALLGTNTTIWWCRTTRYLDEMRGGQGVPVGFPILMPFSDFYAAWKVARKSGSIPIFLKWQCVTVLALIICVLIFILLVLMNG